MAFMQIMTFSVPSDAPEPRTWETATTQNRQIYIYPKHTGTTSHQMKAITCNSKPQELLNRNSNLSFHYCNKSKNYLKLLCYLCVQTYLHMK